MSQYRPRVDGVCHGARLFLYLLFLAARTIAISLRHLVQRADAGLCPGSPLHRGGDVWIADDRTPESPPRIGKINIVLSDDVRDESNGGTCCLISSVVTIDCRNTQSLFRDSTNWLRAVISHELSHVYSLSILNPPVAFATYGAVSSTAENITASAAQSWGMNELPEWFI